MTNSRQPCFVATVTAPIVAASTQPPSSQPFDAQPQFQPQFQAQPQPQPQPPPPSAPRSSTSSRFEASAAAAPFDFDAAGDASRLSGSPSGSGFGPVNRASLLAASFGGQPLNPSAHVGLVFTTPPSPSTRESLATKTASVIRHFQPHRDPVYKDPANQPRQAHDAPRSGGDMFSAASSYLGRSRSGSGSIPGQMRRASGEAEVVVTVLLWQPTPAKHSSSALSKAPILRDVPNVKQRLSKRSSSTSRPEVGPAAGLDRSITLKQSGTSWLREKPSKTRLSFPQSSSSSNGSWRKATALFRDNGILSIFNEDHALLHSIQCSNLSSTDIRSVEDSLFGRPNVLGIFARSSSFVGAASAATVSGLTVPSPSTASAKQEPIFLALSSAARLQYWRTLLKIYAQPEVFGPPGSASAGGTHRRFRQLELTIFEAKSIMAKVPVETQGQHHLHSNDYLLQDEMFQTMMASPAGSNRELPYSPLTRGGVLDKFVPSRSSLDGDTSSHHTVAAAEVRGKDQRPGTSQERGGAGGAPFGRAAGKALPQRDAAIVPSEEADGRQSRAASINDAASSHADDMGSSLEDPVSGPISGLSGRSRFANETHQQQQQQQQPLSSSLGLRQRVGSPRPHSQTSRAREKDLYSSTSFDRYCRIIMNGEVVARTQPRFSNTGSDASYNVEKFKFADLPEIESLAVEVLHATHKTGNGSPTTQGGVAQKYVLLGIVEVPIESLRRGEEVEGRFPIWSIAAVQSGNGELPFHKGLVGELKMSAKLRDETILPLSVYREIEARLHAPDAPDLISGLARSLNEDSVVSHLVEYYTASGTMTERLAALADLESASWGERLEPEMLFRANTLLSRSVDHFQRLLALPWLDSCVGATVRAICDDVRPSPNGVDLAGGSPSTGIESHAEPTAANRSPALGAWFSDLPLTIDLLRKLSVSLWESIYAQRHRCPAELRSVLSDIRTKVNRRYEKSNSTRPGIQGVGAFIFLRLFCAALNAPQLYSLTPCQPSRTSQRKLLLLSKVLLALANKKMSFDKDKDRDLLPLNDFLTTYASAYDDYITVVSTLPPKLQKPRLLGISYDDDNELQRAAQRKIESLPTLHRESIPSSPYMLDRPLTLASLVSFVVRTAEDRDIDADVRSEEGAAAAHRHDGGGNGSAPGAEALKRKRSDVSRRVNEFIDLCCEVEGCTGRLIDAAGYDPQPIRVARHRLSLLRPGDITRLGSVVTTGNDTPPLPHVPLPLTADWPMASSHKHASSGATSAIGDRNAPDRSPRRPTSHRTRSATITAAPYRSPGPSDLYGSDASFAQYRALDGLARGRLEYASPGGVQAEEDGVAFSMVDGNAVAAPRTQAKSSRSAPRGIARVREEDHHGIDLDEGRRTVYQDRTARGARPDTRDSNISDNRRMSNEDNLILMQAEDGSTFEPVYPAPLTSTSASFAGGDPRLGRRPSVISNLSSIDEISLGLTSMGRQEAAVGVAPRRNSRSTSVTPSTSTAMLGDRRHSSELVKTRREGLQLTPQEGSFGEERPPTREAAAPFATDADLDAESRQVQSPVGEGDRTSLRSSIGGPFVGVPLDLRLPVRSSPVSTTGEKKKKWWRPG
ncbi:hypothetical protein ACQY0O_003407 [Thecaphora frezii]